MASYGLYVFHFLFVGPLLILIGKFHDHPKFPPFIWQLLIVMGIGIIGLHLMKAYNVYNLPNKS
jgi:hypothetical protein